MILTEYAGFIKQYNSEFLKGNLQPIELLHIWLNEIFTKIPKTNVEKILHKEILFCKNEQGEYLIVGKSDSGRILVKSLIEFSKSYSNYIRSKWLDLAETMYINSKN